MNFAFATNMGTNPNSTKLIGDIATDLGFRSIHPFSGIGELERQVKLNPVTFFLFDYSADFEKSKAQISLIRDTQNLRIRFAPLVCFVEFPSKDRIIQCVNAGFDDILTLPWSTSKIRARLAKQVNTKHTYFETDSYFGPDRRRFNDNSHDRTQAGPAPGFGCRYYEFVRNNFAGIQILGEKVMGKTPKKQSATALANVDHRFAMRAHENSAVQ